MIRIAAIFAGLCLSFTATAASAQNGLEIYLFRVGQADSMLIVGPAPQRRTMLVDMGVSRRRPFTGAVNSHHVAARIQEITGGRHLDYFMLSHFHGDHFGGDRTGITALLTDEGFTIGTVIDTGSLGREFVLRSEDAQEYETRLLNWTGTSTIQSRELPGFGGGQIDLGPGVQVEILAFAGRYAPDEPSVHEQYREAHPGWFEEHHASENDLSIAFELSLGDFEFWSAGDLSGADGDGTGEISGRNRDYYNVELPLVRYWQRQGRESDVEIFRINHHGSDHSNTPQLFGALDPEHVFYSAHLGYGHPRLPVVDRARRTARQWATGLDPQAWGTGSRFRTRRGRVPGEIRVLVAPDGASYTINGSTYRSFSDAEERADLDAAVDN